MEGDKDTLEEELLGKSIREMFFELNNETESRFEEIKGKYLRSLIPEKEEYFVETLLVEGENSLKYDGYYFPVINKKNTSFHLEEKIYLEDVYLDVSYENIKEITENKYDVWISIDDEVHEMKVVIERDTRYEKKIKQLYNAFKLRGKKWKTLNMSHFKRMYRIRVEEYDFKMTREIMNNIIDNKKEIVYDFGIYRENILMNKKLLWNIEEGKVISKLFIRPIRDNVSYEYVIGIKKGEKVLIEDTGEKDILSCYQEEERELRIISRLKKEGIWKYFSVKPISECRKILNINKEESDSKTEYFHFTNYRRLNFIDELEEKYKQINNIRSKYFLRKKFQEYDFIKGKIILKEVRLDKENSMGNDGVNSDNGNISLYNCNYFIEDDYDLFFNDRKINLDIYVEYVDVRGNYMEDYLSFIISDIQLDMPEYRCRGFLYEG